MLFSEMRDLMAKQFEKMVKTSKLFEVNIDKTILWNLYLDSFPEGTNEIFRVRREYDCSCCHHFMKVMGAVVAVQDNKLISLFDFETGDPVFQPVLDACAAYVKSKPILDIFVTKERTAGTKVSYEYNEVTKLRVQEWTHFYLDFPENLVDKSRSSIPEIKGNYRDIRNVFKRSLDELTIESTETVLDLIYQNSLYKGEEWKTLLESFLKYQKEYVNIPEEDRDIWAWVESGKVGAVLGKIRNHSIGTLLVDISEGKDLETAVKAYETIVAPSNYKRPQAIFTKKMLEDAQQTITELGYLSALERRYAKLDDIHVNDILFTNKDAAKRIVGAESIFDSMMKDVSNKPKTFGKVEEITIDKFISDVLPSTKEVELYLENKHQKNLVSLIAPIHKDSKIMFKWDNNFSWAYTGNMTDSMLKQNVKAAGGDVTGDLRFSIQWNDEDYNPNDFDAHCKLPSGHEIYFGDKTHRPTGGMLDVDIINPHAGKAAVENITFPDRDRMSGGSYTFFVHCYNNRGGRGGFKAEIEFDGQIYAFEYPKELRQGEKIEVAKVELNQGKFKLIEKLPSTTSSKEVWGVTTEQFVPVSTIMYSPNYWQENKVGNKHYFFMLKDCVNPERPNPFFNEYLKEDLMKHKRVFEALGSKCKVEECEDQLSGVGFSSTQRAEVYVKVKGTIERVLKVKF